MPLLVLAPPMGVTARDLNDDGLPDLAKCWPSARGADSLDIFFQR